MVLPMRVPRVCTAVALPLAAVLGAACSGAPPTVQRASSDQAALVIFVDKAKVNSVRPLSKHDDEELGKLGASLTTAIETALSNAGYQIALSASDEHDLTIRPEFGAPAWGGLCASRLVFRLESSRTSMPVIEAPEREYCYFQDELRTVAIHLTNTITTSGRIRQFAKRRGAQTASSIPTSGAGSGASGRSAGRGASASSAQAQVPLAVPATSPRSKSFLVGAPQPNSYAVVIGIEKYGAGIPTPTGARLDADGFAALARDSLGIVPSHIQVLHDDQATKASIERAIDWARASTPVGGRLYFYFAGHGAPDASSATSYLLPSDGDASFLASTGIAMKDLLGKLSQTKAREVLAIVDSCFSGAGGRSVAPPGIRPLIRVKEELAPTQLALFTSSGSNEISGSSPIDEEGLFTHYLLEALGTGASDIDGDGQVSLDELARWVIPRVSRDARKENRAQTPVLTLGRGLGSPSNFVVEWGIPSK